MNNIIRFDGVSNETMGVYVTIMPGSPSPAEKGEAVPIPGRSGTVWKSEGAWDVVQLTASLWVPQDRASNLPSIKAWLSGSGKLYMGATSAVYYEARVDGMVDFVPLDYNDGYTATVTFECQPFRCLDSGAVTTTLTTSGTIANPYTAFSEPLLEIVASGDVAITVGAITFEINDVSGTIFVDSYKNECYTALGLANDKMVGAFPKLLPGDNAVSWTGSVTSIKITPRWRTL